MDRKALAGCMWRDITGKLPYLVVVVVYSYE